MREGRNEWNFNELSLMTDRSGAAMLLQEGRGGGQPGTGDERENKICVDGIFPASSSCLHHEIKITLPTPTIHFLFPSPPDMER